MLKWMQCPSDHKSDFRLGRSVPLYEYRCNSCNEITSALVYSWSETHSRTAVIVPARISSASSPNSPSARPGATASIGCPAGRLPATSMRTARPASTPTWDGSRRRWAAQRLRSSTANAVRSRNRNTCGRSILRDRMRARHCCRTSQWRHRGSGTKLVSDPANLSRFSGHGDSQTPRVITWQRPAL